LFACEEDRHQERGLEQHEQYAQGGELLQPFLSYTTPTAWTYTLQSESFYEWDERQWLVPIRAVVSKITRVGGQLVSIGGGVNYWAESPDGGPEGWGARLTITLLFPR
jgi:hypothetical protein